MTDSSCFRGARSGEREGGWAVTDSHVCADQSREVAEGFLVAAAARRWLEVEWEGVVLLGGGRVSMKQQVSLEDGVLAGPGPGPLVELPPSPTSSAKGQLGHRAGAQGWGCPRWGGDVETQGRSQL